MKDERLSLRLSTEAKVALERAAKADDRRPTQWAERAILAALRAGGWLVDP